eukprot:CAMPEP_0202766830 /NCGR_PEP_ID=MMETSP1388-20130828/31389_1 /ASSEMBLY_ACC=CAM_ASM_000864 /TAXON_ID=37098 /ORGANISM="Isochrysis sp, Strain CCMP1244" /LENGTH=45 /DNA_ID= /DNA_START= /DNA_END= /DNA_ORIENTATION=
MAAAVDVDAAVEQLAEAAASKASGMTRRPWLCFVLSTLALILVFA